MSELVPAFAGAAGTAAALGGANFWNPVGWTIAVVAVVVVVVGVVDKTISYAKSKEKSDPYARPEQKKQGREKKEKKKSDDKDWKNKSGKRRPPHPKSILRGLVIKNIRRVYMHIWTLEKWEKAYGVERRKGLRIRCDTNVDPEVKRACKEFAKWLRKEYFFPIRIPVYIKSSCSIRALNGEAVSATFLSPDPDDKKGEPYIRVAAGDYYELLRKSGKDNALAIILHSIAHELTHYFQWINGLELTEIGEERQATAYAGFILDEYAETREHP